MGHYNTPSVRLYLQLVARNFLFWTSYCWISQWVLIRLYFVDPVRLVACPWSFIHSFIHFRTRFSSGDRRGVATPGGLELPHGFQQSVIVLLASHQDGTKSGRRSNYATWSYGPFFPPQLMDRFPMGVASRTCLLIFPEHPGHVAEAT